MNVVRKNVWAAGPRNVLVWAIEGRRRICLAEFEQSDISIQFGGNCPDWRLSAEMLVCLWHEEMVQALGWDAACVKWRYEIISHHW